MKYRPALAAASASGLLLLSAALTTLGGCASGPAPQPGISSSAEVMRYFGEPVRVWQEADGVRKLEYSSQPFGQRCIMVRLAADGRVLSIEDTLSEASRMQHIVPGMTYEQVSRQLGRERSRVFFPLSGEDVWDWNVAPDTAGGYPMRFNVHFKDGVVVRASNTMVFPSRMFPFGD